MASFRTVVLSGIVMVGGVTLASPAFEAESESATADLEFTKMDTGKDGFLTKDELAVGHARMMKKPSR